MAGANDIDRKVLVLGATGRTGNLVVQEALRKGYQVISLVRNIPDDKLDDANHTYIVGSAYEKEDLKKALNGCSYVINVLNISRNSDIPWSRLRSPKDLMSTAIGHIIDLSSEFGVEKVVVCSAWGVAESKKDIPFWFDMLIENSNIKYAYKDHARQEELISASDLDWVIVRPAGLTNFINEKSIRESFNNNPNPFLTISRNNVAKYLVGALNRPDLNHKKVVISENYTE